MGKSTLAKHMITQHNRVVVYDPQREYPVGAFTTNFRDFKNFLKEHEFNPHFKIGYCPDESDEMTAFDLVCKCMLKMKNCLFVIEEIGRLLKASSYPESINRLIRDSRHLNVTVLGVTQRSADVPYIIRSQATRLISFQQITDRDVKALREISDCPELEHVRQFSQFEFIELNTNTGENKIRKLKIV